jgi:hypothetical protein
MEQSVDCQEPQLVGRPARSLSLRPLDTDGDVTDMACAITRESQNIGCGVLTREAAIKGAELIIVCTAQDHRGRLRYLQFGAAATQQGCQSRFAHMIEGGFGKRGCT